MRESALRLQDKNIVLVGPFNGVTQAIMRTMTEFGADVGFVSQLGPAVSKFVDAVNEGREVHPNYGRAVYLDLPLGTEAQVQEAMGRVVECVGRLDVLIDATPLAWGADTSASSWSSLSSVLAEKMIPFLVAKQRGRVMYLFEDQCLDGMRKTPVAGGCVEALRLGIDSLARKYRAQNIMVNGLSIGVTDDFVLRLHPGSVSLKKTFEEMARSCPGLKLVDSNDVASTVAYLSSALSAGVTGEILRLTHGYHLEPPPARDLRPTA